MWEAIAPPFYFDTSCWPCDETSASYGICIVIHSLPVRPPLPPLHPSLPRTHEKSSIECPDTRSRHSSSIEAALRLSKRRWEASASANMSRSLYRTGSANSSTALLFQVLCCRPKAKRRRCHHLWVSRAHHLCVRACLSPEHSVFHSFSLPPPPSLPQALSSIESLRYAIDRKIPPCVLSVFLGEERPTAAKVQHRKSELPSVYPSLMNSKKKNIFFLNNVRGGSPFMNFSTLL